MAEGGSPEGRAGAAVGPVSGPRLGAAPSVPEEARSSSFSVLARCSACLRRALSDCRVEALDSRAESLASRSLTWRSLRSRKARWLGRGVVLVIVLCRSW